MFWIKITSLPMQNGRFDRWWLVIRQVSIGLACYIVIDMASTFLRKNPFKQDPQGILQLGWLRRAVLAAAIAYRVQR